MQDPTIQTVLRLLDELKRTLDAHLMLHQRDKREEREDASRLDERIRRLEQGK